MDLLAGVAGAIVVAHWSWGLLRSAAAVLLDREAPLQLHAAIRAALETDDTRPHDLHVWSVGPNRYAVTLVVATSSGRSAAEYRALLPASVGLTHVTVEVHGHPEAALVSPTARPSAHHAA